MTKNSTKDVAEKTKIPRATLQHWIATGKIAAPRIQVVNGKATRVWSDAQIERVRQLKGTLKPGPKTKKGGPK